MSTSARRTTTKSKGTGTIWRTRDGRKIAVRDMDPTHLVAAIFFLNRTAETIRMARALAMLDGPRPRGDFAEIAFEAAVEETSRQDPTELVPSLAPLMAEAERRGLLSVIMSLGMLPKWPAPAQIATAVAEWRSAHHG